MIYSETVYQIADDLMVQLDFKDEIYFMPTTREQKEALHLLHTHKVLIIGSRFSTNFLYPGENFNKCFTQGSRSFFSYETASKNNYKLLGSYSKAEWGIMGVIIIIFILILILLYLTILETNYTELLY